MDLQHLAGVFGIYGIRMMLRLARFMSGQNRSLCSGKAGRNRFARTWHFDGSHKDGGALRC